MHSDAKLTLFSSFSLGKINKFLLRSLVRQFSDSYTRAHATKDGLSKISAQPEWLALQKDKEVQQRWAIVVDIAGTLSK